MNFMGMEIQISEDKPGYVLSPDLPISAEQRAKTEAWIWNFFTRQNAMKDGEVVQQGNVWFMNPRTYEKLRLELKGVTARERKNFMHDFHLGT